MLLLSSHTDWISFVLCVTPDSSESDMTGNPHQELKDKGIIDSGCSRHIIGNISYLTIYEEIDGGFVAFGGSTKGGKITGKDFKLTDESHVLLKVPRKDNMYNIDSKNVVPQGGLTCFFVKATPDESNLCHRRLGHVNFKTINKHVKGNLVRVAERKNRTLIEAARTKIADLKLPATFWAEAVNTACYVQNGVLIIKPHNKTPYELFLGRKPALSFMKPFGCHVTILNTIDHLGKFDGKADEGFFIGYSTNSKAFRWRLFDIDVLTKSMNNEPVVAGNQTNGNAGTKTCNDAGKARVETIPSKDYILLPLWTQNSNSKESPDAGFKPSGEEEKKDAEHPENEDKENVVDENIVYRCDDDPNMPNLEEIDYSDDDKGGGAEADMTNLDTNILVSPILTTRVHKDHPVKQIIRDIHSAPQTRRMTKSVINHVEPKKVIQALSDPSWIEVMQDEILQFKLQKV
ncbi:ribonuclease H-like domain-containing protein [Tanacetum coccineum]